MAVNAKGVFLCGQEAARRLAVGGGGAIVNVASMAGKRGAVPFLSHYVASKFAVVGLTQAMAYELAPAGIRVNCVCPGYVATAMQERELAWEAGLRGVTPEEVERDYVADTPLGRLETPDDVAAAVAFLASPASSYITGEALAVNGGSFMDCKHRQIQAPKTALPAVDGRGPSMSAQPQPQPLPGTPAGPRPLGTGPEGHEIDVDPVRAQRDRPCPRPHRLRRLQPGVLRRARADRLHGGDVVCPAVLAARRPVAVVSDRRAARGLFRARVSVLYRAHAALGRRLRLGVPNAAARLPGSW